MSSTLLVTQVVDGDARIEVRDPVHRWEGYLHIDMRDRVLHTAVTSMFITREKAAELRDLLDEALAEPAPDENADEASIAQIRAVGS